MKAIASFLNLDGGKVIIGVSDNKSVNGLEADYGSLPRTDRDGFENHFNHIFNIMLGARFRQFVKLNFEKISNRDICLVEISPSDSPVYVKVNNAEEFFVRTGNATTSLIMSETAEYIKSHWKES
jgi:predicted HTH transcriptional regulator